MSNNPMTNKPNRQTSTRRVLTVIPVKSDEEGYGSSQSDNKPSKRRTLSKLSIVPNGNRFQFHYRGDRLKIPKYQNTYRLEPFKIFHIETVDNIVRNVLENKLSSVLNYHPDNASKLSMETANDVLKAINKREYDRCKIVVQVTIVQRIRQSVHSAFQCLWDAERDNYSYHVFENSHIYAWCCVFALARLILLLVGIIVDDLKFWKHARYFYRYSSGRVDIGTRHARLENNGNEAATSDAAAAASVAVPTTP